MTMEYKYLHRVHILLTVALFIVCIAVATAFIWATQTEQLQIKSEKELLGPYTDISSLSASNIAHAYIIFLDRVKAKHSTWNKADWDYAKAVLAKLDSRKRSMGRIINIDDLSKIKEIEAEFRELEAKGSARQRTKVSISAR